MSAHRSTGRAPARGVRRSRVTHTPASRPDRVAGWAVALGVFLVLVAAATSHSAVTPEVPLTGGARLELGAGEGRLGARVLAEGARGPDVTALQSILRAKGDRSARVTGRFDAPTTSALRRFQARAGLLPDGVFGPGTHRALVRSMPLRRASWYGPGLYGRRTACGRRLRRGTVGAAHRRLACGTPVTVYVDGRSATVPVIDRGPYVRGVSIDLTAAAARKLRLLRTGPVRLAY
jgi:hypothetical protein